MEMHQVRYFLAVAQERNFSRAAEKCNVTQPSLSRAIQQLEGELGGPLFHRERHLTHLTDLGQMVQPHLETVYNAAVKAKKLSQDLNQLKRVPLKLGIMSTISPDEIVDLIAALKTRYDGLELRLCDANAKDLRERVLAGDLEAVIYALPGEEVDERTHVMPLFSEQMVIAVHQGHRLARERAFPVKELNGECYIHRVNCEFAGYADHILQEKGVTCTPTGPWVRSSLRLTMRPASSGRTNGGSASPGSGADSPAPYWRNRPTRRSTAAAKTGLFWRPASAKARSCSATDASRSRTRLKAASKSCGATLGVIRVLSGPRSSCRKLIEAD
jgi:LysR family transcriptional regulator, hydrogen peroxide-inducible genes activator